MKQINIHTFAHRTKKTITSSICMSTIFAMNPPFTNDEFQYGRVNNPTRKILEQTLALLENSKFCSVFASGSSAISTFLLTLRPGDIVLCHNVIYEGTQRLFQTVFNQLDIHCKRVDMNNLTLLESNITSDVKWIFFESLTNPLLEVLDIQSICTIAHKNNIQVAVDNTLASPAVQKPLNLGADIVIESISKVINGHSDVIGGLVATNNAKLHKKVVFLQQTMGAILSPFDCFLVQRGIKTLQIRMKKQQETATKIFSFLSKHKNVKKIHFPGRGQILSFHLRQSLNPSKFLKRLKLITIAQSFGGTETIIQQPTRMMHLSFTKDEQETLSIDDWLFRLSIGLENAQDIIDDLLEALK